MTDGAVNSPKTGTGRHELLTELETPLPAAPMGLPRRTAFPHLWTGDFPGCKTERLSAIASCVPLRYALPGPISREEFPKGRAAARPFVSFQGGAGGNRNPPAFLFRGPGGHSLFKREYPPGFSVPKRYSSAGNSGPLREQQIKPARRTAPRCCCPLSLRQ